MKKSKWLKFAGSLSLTGLLFSSTFSPMSPSFPSQGMAYAETVDSLELQEAFAQAAQEFNVPVEILLAVGYNMSLWEHHGGKPSASGGYGLMHLTDVNIDRLKDPEALEHQLHLYQAGKEDTSQDPQMMEGPATETRSTLVIDDPGLHTLTMAADLLSLPPETLKQDKKQNIRGAAALLAKYAKQTVGASPTDIENWYGAVAEYSGSSDYTGAIDFADRVYETINNGAVKHTEDGYSITLSPKQTNPNKESINALNLKKHPEDTQADCPKRLACHYVPAAYKKIDHDGTLYEWSYGNYDIGNRPNDNQEIKYIVLHDTEISYDLTKTVFQREWTQASAHYVIRSSDGDITQMVDNKDIAWHAGNWYFNSKSIGIEHEGIAIEGAAWYNEQLYHASARLVKHLSKEYNIPLDRDHIIAHDEVPGTSETRQPTMHWDPGPFWDWAHYMQVLGAPLESGKRQKDIVQMRPNFNTNQPILQTPSGEPVPQQSANFVYLYTSPSFDAPLIKDAAIPEAQPLDASNWGNKAVTGQTFYKAEEQGNWTAIWYGGQKAWFYNPKGTNTTKGSGIVVTPKEGKTGIPVYGVAYPEAEAFPGDIPVREMSPLQYTLSPGQNYVATEKVKGSYYSAPVYTYNPETTHKIVWGDDEFYLIHLNHRLAFVRASDVDVVTSHKQKHKHHHISDKQ
ncbi:N-acetylmuramoyl-L-alanine amidase [Bacillus sp. BHET2]|uniref:N-acetylmuramoyl-L-alanine amidase n=1 Tax=Bacillus sp. BHET2 TaxID=2583818 RepID=UPI00110D9A6C|nr:peptidoglycan recognition family protein [Bacillus sp. BHET2]TMU84357.1 N-acetylmuramoyl-L-alanine amidase [Bacillus sp. BHET2]